MIRLLLSFLIWVPLASADVICYDRVTGENRVDSDRGGPLITETPRNVRHFLAMQASQLVYQLSDLEVSKSAEQMLAAHAAFRADELPGYVHHSYFSDRHSGLKYAAFEPVNPQDPWIFAFAGTQSGLDWMSDVNLGRRQYAKAIEFVDRFISCGNLDRTGYPIAGRNWIITGHSLGGGIAQAFAFEARKRRMLHRMTEGRLELVTFNGFGAADLIGDFVDLADMDSVRLYSTNYFVTGDVVSRIGKHVGPTYEIPMPAGVRPGALRSHAMQTIAKSVMAKGYPDFSGFKPSAPPESRVLGFLKDVGARLDFLADIPLENSALEHSNRLRAAAEIIFARDASAPYDKDALRYIGDVAQGFQMELESMVQGPIRDLVIGDLKRLQVLILIHQLH